MINYEDFFEKKTRKSRIKQMSPKNKITADENETDKITIGQRII